MFLHLMFWILWILGLLFGGYVVYASDPAGRWGRGHGFLGYLLLGMLAYLTVGLPK